MMNIDELLESYRVFREHMPQKETPTHQGLFSAGVRENIQVQVLTYIIRLSI